MARLYQNNFFTGIIIVVFVVSGVIFREQPLLSRGIYLSQSTKAFRPIEEKEVTLYITDNIDTIKAVPVISELGITPMGIIRVSTRYNTTAEIYESCRKNLVEARRLAAIYGANKIIGNCLIYDKNASLSGTNLYAYAYR